MQKRATSFLFIFYKNNVLQKRWSMDYRVLWEWATEQSAVRPRTPLWSEVEQAYGIELSNALAGTKTVDDALKDAKTAIEKALKNINTSA